jgi:hypothetical protein
MAKRLVVLVRDQPGDVVSDLGAAGITMEELFSDVYVATADESTLDENLKRLLASGEDLFAQYDVVCANSEGWKDVLGRHQERCEPEPSENDRYVLLHRVGGDAYIDLTDHLAQVRVSARQLAPGIYVAQPSSGSASYFRRRLDAIAADLPGDTAVLRIQPLSPPVPI